MKRKLTETQIKKFIRTLVEELMEGPKQNDSVSIINDDQLKEEIQLYLANSGKIKEITEQIQAQLNQIKELDTAQKAQVKAIERYMNDTGQALVETDSWVASLKEELQYKKPTLGYKELWEEALTKVNDATKKVLNSMAEQQLLMKSKALTKVLKIVGKTVSEGPQEDAKIKQFIRSTAIVLKNADDLRNVVATLPTI